MILWNMYGVQELFFLSLDVEQEIMRFRDHICLVVFIGHWGMDGRHPSYNMCFDSNWRPHSQRPLLTSLQHASLACRYPLPSMYGICSFIWLLSMVNVGKYTIHGCYVVIPPKCWRSRPTRIFSPPFAELWLHFLSRTRTGTSHLTWMGIGWGKCCPPSQVVEFIVIFLTGCFFAELFWGFGESRSKHSFMPTGKGDNPNG